MNNSKATAVKASSPSTQKHSERYISIRSKAETKWPAWKVSTYNTNIAVSAHAEKVLAK